MVAIKGHLIDMAKDTPVYEMADETSESSDTITLDLIKGHLDVFSRDLLCCIV